MRKPKEEGGLGMFENGWNKEELKEDIKLFDQNESSSITPHAQELLDSSDRMKDLIHTYDNDKRLFENQLARAKAASRAPERKKPPKVLVVSEKPVSMLMAAEVLRLKYGKGAVELWHSGLSAAEKEARRTRFEEGPELETKFRMSNATSKTKFLVSTSACLSTGHTFLRGTIAAMLEPPYNPLTINQFAKRAHRIGCEYKCLVIIYLNKKEVPWENKAANIRGARECFQRYVDSGVADSTLENIEETMAREVEV
jgi:hypothetical protein